MPRTLDVNMYPNEEFIALTKYVEENGELEIPGTTTEGMSLRSQFYGWRKAVENDPEGAARLGMRWDAPKGVTMEFRGGVLWAIRSKDAPKVKMLQRALAAAGSPMPNTEAPKGEAQSSFDKLMGKLKPVEGGNGGNNS